MSVKLHQQVAVLEADVIVLRAEVQRLAQALADMRRANVSTDPEADVDAAIAHVRRGPGRPRKQLS